MQTDKMFSDIASQSGSRKRSKSPLVQMQCVKLDAAENVVFSEVWSILCHVSSCLIDQVFTSCFILCYIPLILS